MMARHMTRVVLVGSIVGGVAIVGALLPEPAGFQFPRVGLYAQISRSRYNAPSRDRDLGQTHGSFRGSDAPQSTSN
jgi:hypothetical protein